MIVHDFDIERIPIIPGETDSPLLVDVDAVLSLAIAAKLFEPIARIREVAQFPCLANKSQLSECRALDILRQPRRSAPIEDALGISVGKAPNHIVLSVMHTIGSVKQVRKVNA